MKNQRLFSACLGVFIGMFNNSHISFSQQVSAHLISTGGAVQLPLVHELASGAYDITAYTRYNSDSTHLNFIHVTPGYTVASHSEYRLTAPSGLLYDARPFAGGYLGGGADGSLPFIFHTGAGFNIQWSVWFINLYATQSQVIRVLPRGNLFSAFTSSDIVSTGFHRITGDLAGTSFNGLLMTGPSNFGFNIYDAIEPTPAHEQYLCGMLLQSGDQDGWLVKMDSTGPVWSKRYDFGGVSSGQMRKVIQSGNGSLLVVCPNYSQAASQNATILLKADTSGNPLWCRRIASSTGPLYLNALTETAQNEILLAGYYPQSNFQFALVKLDSTGNLLWARNWIKAVAPTAELIRVSQNRILIAGCSVNPGSIPNQIYLIGLDSAGDAACDFQADNSIAATSITPVVSTFPLTATPFMPLTMIQPLATRNQHISPYSLLCSGTMIAGFSRPEELHIIPNPASGAFYLPDASESGIEEVILYDLQGKPVHHVSRPGRDPIYLEGMRGGMYMVKAVAKDGEVRNSKLVICR